MNTVTVAGRKGLCDVASAFMTGDEPNTTQILVETIEPGVVLLLDDGRQFQVSEFNMTWGMDEPFAAIAKSKDGEIVDLSHTAHVKLIV
jgi:hypothetical protein